MGIVETCEGLVVGIKSVAWVFPCVAMLMVVVLAFSALCKVVSK